MQSYEVEVKSLLGSKENADALLARMQELDPTTKVISKNKQLNHYFIPSPNMEFDSGTLRKLSQVLSKFLSDEAKNKFTDLLSQTKEFSIRSRDKDGTVLFVVKASVGDDTSANGVKRIEFEEKVPLSLQELDSLILSAGFKYQAKWSREREEYSFKGLNVSLDKNAGYGWLTEFEKVISNEKEVENAHKEILSLMAECGVEELPQDRLERMFAFYNEHWPEYYGTDKIFTIQ